MGRLVSRISCMRFAKQMAAPGESRALCGNQTYQTLMPVTVFPRTSYSNMLFVIFPTVVEWVADTEVPQWRWQLPLIHGSLSFPFTVSSSCLFRAHCDILRMTDEGCASNSRHSRAAISFCSLFMYISGSLSEEFRRVASGLHTLVYI